MPDMKRLCETVFEIQSIDSNLLLCGSAALIIHGLLDMRQMSDYDFVVNRRHIDELHTVFNDLNEDTNVYGHPINNGEYYKSYYGTHIKTNSVINLFVFENFIKLNKEIVETPYGQIRIQDVDTILKYKKQYNRSKDKKDLKNIADNCIENILLS